MSKQRLSKIIARSGVASRRKAEELIFEGKVTVNGWVQLLPQTLVDPEVDKLEVDGKKIDLEDKVYYMMNKPAGLLCTSIAAGKGKSVLELFEDAKRLFTVGRLDKDTKGLLLVTNDGYFANQVIHPSKEIEKEYLVKTDRELIYEELVQLSKGGVVEGDWVKPVKVSKVRGRTIKMILLDGKKREVRVLVESIGLKVVELTRIRIGPLVLGPIPVGQHRRLTLPEIEQFL